MIYSQAEIQRFDDFFGVLAVPGAGTSPAEMHGALAGLICIEHKFSSRLWFDALLRILTSKASLAAHQRPVVIDLYDITCRQLNNAYDEFQLLLPNEKYSFAERAIALSQWCNGFIWCRAF